MPQPLKVVEPQTTPPVWAALRQEAVEVAQSEPSLASLVNAVIIRHGGLSSALSYQLARKLGDQELRAMSLREVADEAFASDPTIISKAEADLRLDVGNLSSQIAELQAKLEDTNYRLSQVSQQIAATNQDLKAVRSAGPVTRQSNSEISGFLRMEMPQMGLFRMSARRASRHARRSDPARAPGRRSGRRG